MKRTSSNRNGIASGRKHNFFDGVAAKPSKCGCEDDSGNGASRDGEEEGDETKATALARGSK